MRARFGRARQAGGRTARQGRRTRRTGGPAAGVLLGACLVPPSAVAAPDGEPGSGPNPGPDRWAKAAAVESAGWVADPPIPVGREGFGVDIVGVYDGRMPTFDVGAVRLWDDYTRWSSIERQPGVFDWTVLDALVSGARAKGLPVLYTMGQTPRWANPDGPECPYQPNEPCTTAPPDDLSRWDEYVRQVATRYKGRIQAYELWNEATRYSYRYGKEDWNWHDGVVSAPANQDFSWYNNTSGPLVVQIYQFGGNNRGGLRVPTICLRPGASASSSAAAGGQGSGHLFQQKCHPDSKVIA